MTTREPWIAPTIVPTLAYDDVPAAAAWLARAFGFRERAGSRLAWPDGCMTWLEIGDGLVHLTTSDAHGARSPRAVAGASHALKVYVADLDAHFAAARAAGATIVSEPENGFWGGRIYRAEDVEGHPWEFSQQGRDLAVQHWRLPPGTQRS